MNTSRLAQEIASLPPEAQRQIMDFVAFLKTRYADTTATGKSRRIPLVDEPFIGMWQGREDMQDSTAWVRNLRHREWERKP